MTNIKSDIISAALVTNMAINITATAKINELKKVDVKLRLAEVDLTGIFIDAFSRLLVISINTGKETMGANQGEMKCENKIAIAR